MKLTPTAMFNLYTGKQEPHCFHWPRDLTLMGHLNPCISVAILAELCCIIMLVHILKGPPYFVWDWKLQLLVF